MPSMMFDLNVASIIYATCKLFECVNEESTQLTKSENYFILNRFSNADFLAIAKVERTSGIRLKYNAGRVRE